MLKLKDMLTRNKGNEIFLVKTEGKIKGRIHLVKERLEDFKFEIDLRNNKARVVINEGIKIKIKGQIPTYTFSYIKDRVATLIQELKSNGCVTRLLLFKIKAENSNGRLEIFSLLGMKIKISTREFDVEIKYPTSGDIQFAEQVIKDVLFEMSKLDFYISLL